MNQLVLLLFILKFFVPPHFRDPLSPDCEPDKLTNSVQSIVRYLSEPNFFYPTKPDELEPYCRLMRNATRHINVYSQKCAGQPARSVFSVFAWSFRRATKRYCARRGAHRQEMFDFAQCINPNKARTARCFNVFMKKFANANSVKVNSKKFPYLCCTIVDLNECVKITLDLSGVPACTERNIQNYFHYVESVGSSVMNSLCSEFEPSNQCDSILRLPTRNATKPKERDPFSIFLNLVEDF